MDLIEDRNSNMLTAVFELPGVKTGDINLQIREGNLIVMGERRPPPIVQKALGAQKPLPRNPIAAADELVSGETCADSPTSSIAIAELPVHELRFGTFYRALPVPCGIKESDVTAALQDGMLTVTWPKLLQRTSLPLTSSTVANAAQ
jgi:HSP20 family molecular chaperone IbpA